MQEEPKVFARHERALKSLDGWARASGAPLLIIDPSPEDDVLRAGMASRGIHVTWSRSGLDGLVAFGRTNPRAVIVSPYVTDVAPEDVVATIRHHSTATVIAVRPVHSAADAGALVVAGARAVLQLPYAVDDVWQVLHELEPSLDDHTMLAYGPIELDASAYTVRVSGVRIPDPPPKEFQVLRALLLEAPGITSDDDLATALWGTRRSGGRDNSMSVHVRRLRTRLGGIADIRRIRGRGYALTLT